MEQDQVHHKAERDARVDGLTRSILTAIEPVIAAQIRQQIGTIVAELMRDKLAATMQSVMADLHVQTQPEQQARRAQTGFTGTSTAGVIEFMRLHADRGGVLGAQILDYLQAEKGVENRETARKAVTRTREMGFIRKDVQNRWHATDKLKELPS
ncbi:hypothetical protein ACXIUS_19420 [Bosea thiooxidans]